jgi:uncharacterized membrane protein
MKYRMTSITLFILLVITLVALGPLAVIWAVNTLFGAGIAYTIWTWLAVIVLSVWIQTRVGRNGKTSR